MAEIDAKTLRAARQHVAMGTLIGVDFVPITHAQQKQSSPHEAEEVENRADTGGVETVEKREKHTGDSRDDMQEKVAALARLRERYEAEKPHEPFITQFTNIVFGEGNPNASLMFIGEGPGAEEDKTGRPFVGRAGQLLDKMIAAMGLDRRDVYIANVMKVRPPNNATPTGEQSAASWPYLREQIEIIKPRVIVTLGLPAARIVLGVTDSMGNLRGRWGKVSDLGFEVPVMPTYHPAYLLRAYTKENREKVWSDLQQVIGRLRA